MTKYQELSEAKNKSKEHRKIKLMCKMNNVTVGIKKLDFSSFRGKMAAFLTDGRQIIVPLSFFPEIKNLSLKQRSEWMILDDQYFTFADLSKVYSVCDLLRQ